MSYCDKHAEPYAAGGSCIYCAMGMAARPSVPFEPLPKPNYKAEFLAGKRAAQRFRLYMGALTALGLALLAGLVWWAVRR